MFRGFEKAAQKSVAKVGIFRDGRYLMGVRQDNGKWTEPGGHLEKGESPEEGAIREVKEETGISLSKKDLDYLGSKEIPDKDLVVHAFKTELDRDKKMTVEGDPDDEVFGWNWIKMRGKKLPDLIQKNLHVPPKYNTLHFFLGFEKSAANTRQYIMTKVRVPSDMRAFLADVPNQAVQEYSEKYYEKKRKQRSKSSSK